MLTKGQIKEALFEIISNRKNYVVRYNDGSVGRSKYRWVNYIYLANYIAKKHKYNVRELFYPLKNSFTNSNYLVRNISDITELSLHNIDGYDIKGEHFKLNKK